MFCSKCGAEIPDGAQWCPKCGDQQGTPTQNREQFPGQATNAQFQSAPGVIPGFILSLAGLLLDWIPIAGLALSIVGVVLCGKGKKQVASNPSAYANSSLLTVGQVLGIIGIVGGSVYLVIWLIYALIFGGGTLMLFDFIKDMASMSS